VETLGIFPAFCGTRRFITPFTRALHLYLSRARPKFENIRQPPAVKNVSTEVKGIVRISYQATTVVVTADLQSVVSAVVNCRMC
jgi:hypothetical protein